MVLNFLFGRYTKTTNWCILSLFLLHFFYFYKMMTCPTTWCFPESLWAAVLICIGTAAFSPLVLSDRAQLKQVDLQKKISIQYKKKNTERRAEIFSFSFFLSLNLSWVYLFETDWANVQTKLLICATNVQRCNVEDGKTRWFIRSVFNDCLAPLASVSLQGCNKKTKQVQ